MNLYLAFNLSFISTWSERALDSLTVTIRGIHMSLFNLVFETKKIEGITKPIFEGSSCK